MQCVGFFLKNSQKCIKLWGIENNINTYHAGLRTIICQYSCQYFSASQTCHQERFKIDDKHQLFFKEMFAPIFVDQKYQKDTQNVCIWSNLSGQAKLLVHAQYSNSSSNILGKNSVSIVKSMSSCLLDTLFGTCYSHVCREQGLPLFSASSLSCL